jgi:8-oxo-dGTP diphosphatase
VSLAGQRLQTGRYTLLPRTLTFLRRPGQVLLMRVPQGRGAWAGRYNGIGGHIEQGEDPLTGAQREIREETGLTPGPLELAGVVIIDTGTRPGIGLHVFSGQALEGDLRASGEGQPEWIALEDLDRLPLVEDLPVLLPKVLSRSEREAPFSALYRYDSDGRLSIEFAK